jgi:hypothetical protein
MYYNGDQLPTKEIEMEEFINLIAATAGSRYELELAATSLLKAAEKVNEEN